MTKHDWKAFVELMDTMSEMYRAKPLSEKAMSMMFAALGDLSIAQIAQGVTWHSRHGGYCPNACEIREAVLGSPGQRATEAWIEIMRAIRAHGSYVSIVVHDEAAALAIEACGGWISLCYMPQADGEAVFRRHYIAAFQRIVHRDFVKKFRGQAEVRGDVASLTIDIRPQPSSSVEAGGCARIAN